MLKIAIIGVGELGQALGRIIPPGLYQLSFWDCNENLLSELNLPNISLPEALLGADIVFLCMPSWRVKEFLAYARVYWSKQTIATFFSKGLDPQTQQTPFELAVKLLPTRLSWAVVGGAMIAEEIKIGHQGACLVASKKIIVSEKIVEIFRGTNILAESSSDFKGVTWSGVLKNVYALGLGLTEGLGWTVNERSLLLARSVEEILKLVKIFGGRPETFLNSPILADFISTSFNEHSLNHQLGLELGQTGQTNKKSEGSMSLPSLLIRLSENKLIENFPILNNLSKIIINQEDPRKIFLSH